MTYGFIIGMLAHNQFTALALMKSGNVIVLGVPLVALLLPDKYEWPLYIFPQYWGFEALRRVFLDVELSRGLANALSLLFSVLLLLVLIPRIRRQFKLG